MGQPNPPVPPGNTPLVEGLDASWNDIVSAIPEDRRAEFGPKIRERIQGYESLKGYEDFAKSNIEPDHISTALNIYSVIENNPREVYEAIGKHLGITPQQAQQLTEEAKEETGEDDPLIALQKQMEQIQNQNQIMAQILYGNYQDQQKQTQQQQEEQQLDKELADLKKKVGDYPEDEIIMRMLHMNLSAEEAYKHYNDRVSEIQKRRPAPFVMGSGGQIPHREVDVTKLSREQTKDFVAQSIAASIAQGR